LAVEGQAAEDLLRPVTLKPLAVLEVQVSSDERVERRRLGRIRDRHICFLPINGEGHRGIVFDNLRPRVPGNRPRDRPHVFGGIVEWRIEDDDRRSGLSALEGL
jgi:hypothetical protein